MSSESPPAAARAAEDGPSGAEPTLESEAPRESRPVALGSEAAVDSSQPQQPGAASRIPVDDDDALPLSAAAAARLLEAELESRRASIANVATPAEPTNRSSPARKALPETLILRGAALIALGFFGGLVALAWTLRELGQSLRAARVAAETSLWTRPSERSSVEASPLSAAGQLAPFANGESALRRRRAALSCVGARSSERSDSNRAGRRCCLRSDPSPRLRKSEPSRLLPR
jgi:hypothetical protein